MPHPGPYALDWGARCCAMLAQMLMRHLLPPLPPCDRMWAEKGGDCVDKAEIIAALWMATHSDDMKVHTTLPDFIHQFDELVKQVEPLLQSDLDVE